MNTKSPTNTQIIIGVIVAIIIIAIACFSYSNQSKSPNAGVSGGQNSDDQTTDGVLNTTTVSNTTVASSISELSFKYPKQLSTKYIHSVDWPPQVKIVADAGKFVCKEGGSNIMPAGSTSKQNINSREYCVTKESEGAAGSTYTQYSYMFPIRNKIVSIGFVLRSVQCGNYDDPQKTLCENERKAFNIDNIVDSIAQSIAIL